MRDTTVYLPKSLRQPPNIDADSAVDCHAKLLCTQPPISHQLETILLASSLDAQTAKGNFVIKQGRRNQTRHSLRETPQGFAMSRQQANGTVLTSVSSQKTRIQQREVLSSCKTPLPFTCQSLCTNHQTSTLSSAVDCHAKLLCNQPPSAINLKPHSWHRHWMLRQPRETLSSKQGLP